MATESFDEKVVVTDPEMVDMMKRDIEGEDYKEDEDMQEKVKKALEACTTIRYQVGGCKQCPYEDDCNNGTQDQLCKDALALINRLEEDKARLENKLVDVLCSVNIDTYHNAQTAAQIRKETVQIKLLDRISVSWEFAKKDSPIVCIFYQDKDGNVYMLRSSYEESGVANIGKKYRTCFNKMKPSNKEERDYAENPQI